MLHKAVHSHYIAIFFILIAIFISTIYNTPTSALTYQNSTDVEFTLNPTISINLSSNDLIIDNLTPGSSSDSNIITVDISTNAGYGYYMSATAGTSTGNTDLTNQSSSSAKFTNLSSNVANLSSFPDNNWGYSYSTDNGTTWISGSEGNTSTGYNGLPLDNDDSGATGIILSSTDSFTNTGSIKFKIGAKASTTQATGTYTNTVNFYAVANPEPQLGPEPCEAGKICYHVNSLTQTEGTMGKQTAGDDGATVTLLASNYSRQGYGFAGWSDTYDYTGNLYGPQEDITVPTGTTINGLSLYAIWIRSAGSMQSDATSICSGLTAASSTTKTLNSVSALTDQRDGDTYAIAKLADGKCWMIENLRLDNTAELTLANTNNPLNDGINVTLKHNYTDTDTYNTLSATSNVAYDADVAPYGWCTSNSDTCDDQSRLRTDNTLSRAISPTVNTSSMYSYGNYYNWYSATAGNGFYNLSSGEVVGDLCPSGWKLPIGKVSTGNIEQGESDSANKVGSFSYLDRKMGGTGTEQNTTEASLRWREYPVNYLYSGFVSGRILSNQGRTGNYWPSTAFSTWYAFDLSLGGSGESSGTSYGSKFLGRTVRCLAQAY